jgi:pimeloyl-ACP methyl ester carboxylesterase
MGFPLMTQFLLIAAIASPQAPEMRPTMRHFGEAGKEGPFGLETHAGDLLAQLTCEPVHLVGWSYGADVALTTALQAPERVQSFYLVEPGCPGALDEQSLTVFMADAGAMFGPVFGQVGAGKQQEVVATLTDGSGGRPGYFAAQSPQCDGDRQPAQAARPDWSTARLAGLRQPVCIVQGAQTRALFVQHLQRWLEQQP